MNALHVTDDWGSMHRDAEPGLLCRDIATAGSLLSRDLSSQLLLLHYYYYCCCVVHRVANGRQVSNFV